MASRLLPDLGHLVQWITHRRWFATKSQAIDSIEVLSATGIALPGGEIEHVIARVTSQGRVDDYQLLLAKADADYVSEFVHADSVISPGSHPVYELFGNTSRLVELQELFNQERTVGPITFHRTSELELASTARVISSEQSNSSVIFGDQAIAKFYRRLIPGLNPDLEVGLALSGSEQTAAVLAWMSGQVGNDETTLAVMHRFFSTAVDGFEHALASVRDLIATPDISPDEAGGDFSSESQRLGEAIARVHMNLDEAFGSATMSSSDTELLIAGMHRKLDEAIELVPALGRHESPLRAIYNSAGQLPIKLQRIHGDLHLGQVLRDTSGWVVLDFEGEPGTPLAERRRLAPSLRDVAGMLRSFDYAARQPLIANPHADIHLPRTSQWAERNRRALLAGYTNVLPLDWQVTAPLMRALEAEKAVYEAVYEHRFRPDWIGIPLGGIERLVEGQ